MRKSYLVRSGEVECAGISSHDVSAVVGRSARFKGDPKRGSKAQRFLLVILRARVFRTALSETDWSWAGTLGLYCCCYCWGGAVPSGEAGASGISDLRFALAAVRKGKFDSRLTDRGAVKSKQLAFAADRRRSHAGIFFSERRFSDPRRTPTGARGRNSQAISKRRSRVLGPSGRKEGIYFPRPGGGQISTAFNPGPAAPQRASFREIQETFLGEASRSFAAKFGGGG